MGNQRDSGSAVKVGVLLASPPAADLRRWLAAAAAFDAAGADALWIDTGDELDPLAVAAALAALTVRSLLVTAAPQAADDRTIATLDRLSRGRFALSGEPAGAIGGAAFQQLDDGGFVREIPGGEPQRWIPVAWAGGRAAWAAAIAEAAEGGATGILVPAQPPLLDILRNPGGTIDRGDLQLAQG